MEEKIIKILELVQAKDDGTVEFSEESKKLIHEVAEKCRILPIYQQNKEKVNTYKDGMTAKQVYIDISWKYSCSDAERQTAIMLEKIISTLIQPESPDTALLQSGGTKISLHTFTIMM